MLLSFFDFLLTNPIVFKFRNSFVLHLLVLSIFVTKVFLITLSKCENKNLLSVSLVAHTGLIRV